MNLIERLGGYEAAKVEGERWGFDDFLNNQLLEYRRQHNIFEVGDWIVDIPSNLLFQVFSVEEDIILTDSIFWINIRYLRHATDEEIEAGKIL